MTPADSPPPGGAPLGSRLWMYSNFHCNLACDYCCAESSPRAAARLLPVEVALRAAEEFAGLGGREVLLTGGEPFLHPQLGELVDAVTRWTGVTILTNAMVFESGRRRRALEWMDRDLVTMQVSLDSATPQPHDRHRGPGSFERARRGIELLRELGFHVRVAATVEPDALDDQAPLRDLLASDGIPPEDQLVRPIAWTGFADHGLSLDVASLWPEPALAADGAWWHPVGVAEDRMLVSSTPLPVITVMAVIRATLNDPERDRADALEVFRCV